MNEVGYAFVGFIIVAVVFVLMSDFWHSGPESSSFSLFPNQLTVYVVIGAYYLYLDSVLALVFV